ncbi:MAG: hypothetical protein ACFBSC_07945 [Microcoleaceae cyanobacterium]
MTQDVRQWLTEIKQLKQQLAETQRDRDTAQESADQWRERYNTEAQQRRDDAKRHQELTTNLRGEVNRLQTEFLGPKNELVARVAIKREVEQLKTGEELKERLLEIMQERDHLRSQIRQLTEDLKQEKASHLQTRNSLTTALGDTVDLLTKAEKAGSSSNGLSLPGEEPLQSLPQANGETPKLAESIDTIQKPLPRLLVSEEAEN